MTMRRFPRVSMPGFSTGQQPSPLPNVTLNPSNFESLIKSQGIQMIHSRPIPCPNGVQDIRGHDHDPSCPLCYNGFLYYNSRPLVAYMMANNANRQFNATGSWDIDTATVVVPERYDDGTPVDITFFDQLMVPDYLVRYYQRVEHSQTGQDRLHFPAVTVDKILDSSMQSFQDGVDFTVESGRIVWLPGGRRPGWDTATDRGIIYSINYYIRPYFTVIQLPHQIRSAQTRGNAGGPNVEARFPQLVVVRKDFIPIDPADKTGNPADAEPRDGSAGTGQS